MKYNFDEDVERRDTYSLKWDVGATELPMWVADMDFKTAPEITKAIVKRAEHGVFGYNIVPEDWYNAYINWWSVRHNFKLEKNWLIFCTGVVPAISSIVRKLTTPAENVVLLTPVYNIFFNSVLNNGRNVLECPLVYDNGSYSINFAKLESLLSNPQTTMLIFCNPHNPVGKIWDRESIEKVGVLCLKHNVIVISDEIHCDLTKPGKDYIPFASVSEECKNNSITCVAPTKTFNIAGLQTSAVIIPNENLRCKVNRALNTDEVAEPNSFAVCAAVAAYTYGADWLDNLRIYIDQNRSFVSDFIEREIPNVRLVKSEATYLLWLDCGKLEVMSSYLSHFIRENTGLYLSSGSSYGKGGENFLRLNIACPRERLSDGLTRLKKAVLLFEKRTRESMN
jgi:cystathionine beta-lyase